MPLEAGDITALAEAIKNLQQPAQATVNVTAVKLPSFWQGNPEVWFRQVESVFTTRNPAVTVQQSKFEYVIQALENNTSVTEESCDKEVEIAPGFLFDSINTVQPGLDYQAMASAQADDPDVQAYRMAITSLRFKDVPFANGTSTLLCDVSTGVPRPVVPEAWRRLVFDTVHSLSHLGARTTKRLVSQKFVWHGLGKQITE